MQTAANIARNGVQRKSAMRKTFSISMSVLAPKGQNRCTRGALKVNAIAAPMSTEVSQPESQPIFEVRQQFIPNMADISSFSLCIYRHLLYQTNPHIHTIPPRFVPSTKTLTTSLSPFHSPGWTPSRQPTSIHPPRPP